MLKYLMVMLLVSSPLMAENGFDRGSRHEARASKDRHDPKSAKQVEAARLDGLYAKEVAAYQDYQATGRISSYSAVSTLNDAYQNAVEAARFEKRITPSYREKTLPGYDFGQCCPFDDANNDGFADGSAGDPTGDSSNPDPDGIGGIP